MYKTRLYNIIKPLLPRQFQIFMRRKRANLILNRYESVWPIDEIAGRKPDSWQGWPASKKFALVLTHDVESAAGQDKVLDIMKMERELGFRSAFYFVPEAYEISQHILEELHRNGFETGLHGLKHDGKLYFSRSIFRRRAKQINRYIAEWKASGFRSPCMHHNLPWLHDLNVEYDASTYDTDPFEPMGGGVKTIFPFIVGDTKTDRSFVELPYTLPQDFLLFVLMQQTGIDIWQKKLEWISRQEGMALIITHPDYMKFNNGTPGNEEYPAEYYRNFLEHIKKTYEDQYWQPTPGEVARFWREQNLKIKDGQ